MYYKLTDQNYSTHGGFKWDLGTWYRINIDKRWTDIHRQKGLCTSGWFHCYDSPLVALFRNPGDANIHAPRLFVVNAKGTRQTDRGLKFGFTMMRLKEEIDVPEITDEQRVKFGILCAMRVYGETQWTRWAENWIDGERSYQRTSYIINEFVNQINGPVEAAHRATLAARCLKRVPSPVADIRIAKYAAIASHYAAHAGDIDLRPLARQAME